MTLQVTLQVKWRPESSAACVTKEVLTCHRLWAWLVVIGIPCFHAKCSSTYSDVVSDVLAIVKKVCVTCPCCKTRLRSLPAKLEEVEKKLDEFVARVEEKFSDLKGSSLPAQRICSPDIDVDKAVKDAVSAINIRAF